MVAVWSTPTNMYTFPSEKLTSAIRLHLFSKKLDQIRFQKNCIENGENNETEHLGDTDKMT